MAIARKHGITSTTPDALVIDSGAVYYNYDEVSEALIGATRGGNSFVIETEYRQMEVDGARGPVKGMQRITNVMAKITANFLEIDDTLLDLALTGSSKADNTTYYTWTRALDIVAADYATNIAIVGEVSGSNVPVVCKIKNALAVGGFELSFTDKEESVLTVEFTAHFDTSDLDTEPWEIEYPTGL